MTHTLRAAVGYSFAKVFRLPKHAEARPKAAGCQSPRSTLRHYSFTIGGHGITTASSNRK